MSKEKVSRTLSTIAEWYGVTSWPEAIREFSIAELNGDESNPETRKAVATLLLQMEQDARRGIKWDDYKSAMGIRKASGALNPFSDADTHAKAFGVVLRYMASHISEAEALAQLQKLAPIKARQAQTFIGNHRAEAADKLADASNLNGQPITSIRKP